MIAVTDFHSHILPGIDDGSASTEESIELLRMESRQGIRRVIATPHFYAQHDTPERFLRRRAEAEARLREEMKKHEDMPQLLVGAEVYFFSGISESDILPDLAIDGKRYVLVEMPHAPWTEAMYRELEAIHSKSGLTPIIAHVDRYISRFHTFKIPQRLAELPVLVQANAEFFLRRSTASMALRMLKQDMIHLLGSDCHDLKTRRPDLEAALRLIGSRLGEEALERVIAYEQLVLDGDRSMQAV